MPVDIPEETRDFGFAVDPGGTHTSRTMMLAGLRLLLAACPPSAIYQEYRSAIADDNVLLKSTATTRLRTLRGLRELYALDRHILLFRALRELWNDSVAEQPLLALLCAAARDPLLRTSAAAVLDAPLGAAVTAEMLAKAVGQQFPGHYNPAIEAKIGRNLASSWQQAGHLHGRRNKLRARALCGPAVTSYALLLGHLCGSRGAGLFSTLWARLLDVPAHTMQAHAVVASQRGWIEYRHAGSIVEVGFRYLLRDE
ncbi:MAG TPA: hypothetical protein VLA19_02990 [Herpetosiphonaceae bacterium]|nr:hypothetical protein [Herpetosiphonaceae bacterium]